MNAKNMTLRSGFLLVIPPLSSDMKLSKIIPTGYENLTYFQNFLRGGFKEMVTISVLDKSGDTAKDSDEKIRKFKWTHTYQTTGTKQWLNDGHWFRQGDSTDVIGDKNEEVFKMGEALWIEVSANVYDATKGKAPADQIKVRFPGLDDTYAE